MIRKGDPWKKVCTAIKKFVTMLFIFSAISFSTERTEIMITDTAGTFTYTYHDNIIYLPRGPLGRYVSRRTLCERGLVLMVTYTELFQFVIMLCAVITLVIHFTRKK